MNEAVVFSALLRSDLRYFIWKAFVAIEPGTPYLPNWHIDAVVHQLMLVHNKKIHRLLINQPPRSLKSICVSVAYVAWLLGHDPTRKIIVASYNAEFAATLHRQFRVIIQSPWYQALFPAMRVERDSETELITTAGGGRYATSIGGTLTGRGADLIIIDDPHKAEELTFEPARRRVIDWYSGTLVSRLNDKAKGAIIVVMQRLHEDDLTGHLIRQRGWHHLNLPAIALEDSVIPVGGDKSIIRRSGDVLHPQRESKETLDRLRVDSGSLKFWAQYQQQPVPLEGNRIQRRWFRYYGEMPEQGANVRIVQSWDVASTIGEANDYSVCTTWQIVKSDFYLIDVFRAQLQYPDLRRAIGTLASRHGAGTILIENAGPGMMLLQDLQRNTPHGMPRPIGCKPQGSKLERMAAQSAKIEAGHVYLPRQVDWLASFLYELLAFPHGRHDDQVDSVSQFLNWVVARNWEPDIGSPVSIPNDFDPP